MDTNQLLDLALIFVIGSIAWVILYTLLLWWCIKRESKIGWRQAWYKMFDKIK
jgi:hypothetical protein